MIREELEEQTRTLEHNGVALRIIRTDPFGFWYFKKHGNNNNVPPELKDHAFTTQQLAESAFKNWVDSKNTANKKD